MKPAKGTPSKVRKTGGNQNTSIENQGVVRVSSSKYVDRVRNKRIQDDEKFF